MRGGVLENSKWLPGRKVLILLLLLISLPSTSAFGQKKLTIAAENDWYPYTAERNGNIEGWGVDVIRSAYAAVGIEVNFVALPFTRCLHEVSINAQLGCFNVVKDVSTGPRFLFHKIPIYTNQTGIYAMKTSKVPLKVKPTDLEGYTVGYTNGYTYGDYLMETTKIKKSYAINDISNLKMLALNRHQYSLIGTFNASFLLHQYRKDFTELPVLTGVLDEQPLYVAFSKSNKLSQYAARKLDQGLKILKASGEYKRIKQKWDDKFQVVP